MQVIREHSNSNLKAWLTHEPCTCGVVPMQSVESIVPVPFMMHFIVQECQLRELLQGRWPEVQMVGLDWTSRTTNDEPSTSSGGRSSPDDPTGMWG